MESGNSDSPVRSYVTESNVRVLRDSYGNTLVVEEESIWLVRKFDNGKRKMVGQIDFDKRVLTVVRHVVRHLHKSSDGYGFCHYVLNTAKLFDRVLIREVSGNRTERGRGGKLVAKYLVPVSWILENGYFLQGVEYGFNVRIFVKRSDLKQFLKK